VSCMGEGPFEDDGCSTRLKAPPSTDPRVLGVLGYHEGARRVMSCSEGGKIVGIEVGWNVPDGKDHSMYMGETLSQATDRRPQN
jgi:hypothetical protein